MKPELCSSAEICLILQLTGLLGLFKHGVVVAHSTRSLENQSLAVRGGNSPDGSPPPVNRTEIASPLFEIAIHDQNRQLIGALLVPKRYLGLRPPSYKYSYRACFVCCYLVISPHFHPLRLVVPGWMELDYSDIPRKEESLTLNYCSTCGRQLSHLSTNCRYGTFCLSQPTSSTSVHRTDSRSRTGTDLKTNYKTSMLAYSLQFQLLLNIPDLFWLACLCYCPPGTYCEATTQFGASCATASSSHPKIAMEDESKLSNLGSSGLSSPNSTNPNSWSPMSLNSIFSSVTSPDCYSDTSSISSNPLRYVPTRDRRRSKQQPYRNARHKISLPSSPAPTSPDPSTTILTPHEIKRETHELPDLSSFPVEKSRNDLVKQEGIEDEGLVHECRDRTEQTSPKVSANVDSYDL